jgi:anti-repressor protein
MCIRHKMNIEISKNKIGEENIDSVNARDLHKSLEITKDFSTWVQAQIKRAGLSENIDYVIFTEKVTAGAGSTNKIHYILKAESAKHIAMMSQGNKAKEVRNYFIEIEKSYQDNSKIKSLNGRIGGLTSTNNMYKNKITLLENQLKNQKLLPPGKTLDEKANDLAKEIDEILTKNPDSFDFMQNRAKYLSRYVQILQSNGTEQQKFMLSEIERYKKQFVEESDKRNQAVWKMEKLKNTIDEYVLISNKMLKYRHEE